MPAQSVASSTARAVDPSRHRPRAGARSAGSALALLLRALAPVPMLAAAAAATAVAATAVAQPAAQRVVSGTVVTQAGQRPLADAQVGIEGTTLGASTDASGHFRIANVPGDTARLTVRHIGYQPTAMTVRVGAANVVIQMAERALELNQVVVTGTPGATQRRALGNAVTNIDAASVTEVAPIQSMQQLLNGRAPGVVVMPTSGAVGTGSLGNNPLLYVDGVRVNNASATGPASQSFGSSPISRLNDINPDDIESIEILKGPSAATLYGTEASNGVINVITKRGTTGAARWNVMVRQGVNYFRDWRNRFPTNYGVNPATKQLETLNMDSLVAGNGGDLFRNGRHQEAELAVNGGSPLFNYYASGSITDADGAEPSNYTRKYGTRVNLGITPSPKLHLTTSLGYVTGPTYLSAEAGFGGRVWTTLLATPTTYNTWQHGFYSGIPVRYDEVYKMWQDLDRFTASVTAEHTPISWFRHRLTIGFDRTAEGNNYLFPRIDSLVSDPTFGSDALGYRELGQATTTYRTVDYAATGTWNATKTLRFETSAGAQYYKNATDSLLAFGSVFPAPGLESVAATTSQKGQSQDFTEDATLGYYGQEQIAWNDRLFVTAAVRSDKSSAFGTKVGNVTYPKFSFSYVISEEPWWSGTPVLHALTSLRLRGAYGEAGKAPTTYAALRTFAPVSGPGDSPAVTPQYIGNPDLGPERGVETELGLDASAFDDRAGLAFTFYNKKTTDAILFQQLAPSIGFNGTQPFNAGGIRNRGVEVSLRGTPVRTDRFTWDLNATYNHNDNEVLDLLPGVNSVVYNTYSAGPVVMHKVGFPAFAFFDHRVVAAQLDGSGNAIKSSVMCDDGKGGSTPCYDASGSVVAPLVYVGQSVAPTDASLSTTFSFLRNFRLYGQLDLKSGQKKVDGNTRARCFFFGGRCIENFDPLHADPIRVAQVQSNRALAPMVTTDGSFAKLREITLAYTIPEPIARRAHATRASLALSGRNLHTWTNYAGFEPEAMFNGGSRGGNIAFEQTTLPQLTSWLLTLNVGF
jgi:TonB-linked SusC/RagA family outer membrane protein